MDTLKFWTDRFWEDAVSEDETYPQRVLAAWRVCRALARVKGILAEDEPLDDRLRLLDQDGNDQWHARTTASRGMSSDPSIPESLHSLVSGGKVQQPLPVHPEKLTDPKDLRRFSQTVELLSKWLGLNYVAVRGLDKPQGFPPKEQILQLEQELVEEAMLDLQEKSTKRLLLDLRENKGLTLPEALIVLALARRKLQDLFGTTNTEQDRALVLARLEALYERAKEALDLRAEIAALKLIAMVQGLTSKDPEQLETEFMKVVGAVSAYQEKKQIMMGTEP